MVTWLVTVASKADKRFSLFGVDEARNQWAYLALVTDGDTPLQAAEVWARVVRGDADQMTAYLERLLVVTDDPAISEFLESALELVKTVPDPRQALPAFS